VYRTFAVALLILSFGLSRALAQETINNASLSGRVTDKTGAVIQNATVIVRSVSTDQTTTVATDAGGRVHLP
jgi:hypothetical protein